jgi:hypothetical protein
MKQARMKAKVENDPGMMQIYRFSGGFLSVIKKNCFFKENRYFC